ncbi:POK18 protein, partial [Ceuthmochares aereus]|nr:POK18 protein [Ceuthmochares aereus]
WKYLGCTITDSQIRLQKLNITVNVKSLHDVQKLLGDLQWLRPIVGISNDDLEQLRPLLKGCDPALP